MVRSALAAWPNISPTIGNMIEMGIKFHFQRRDAPIAMPTTADTLTVPRMLKSIVSSAVTNSRETHNPTCLAAALTGEIIIASGSWERTNHPDTAASQQTISGTVGD